MLCVNYSIGWNEIDPVVASLHSVPSARTLQKAHVHGNIVLYCLWRSRDGSSFLFNLSLRMDLKLCIANIIFRYGFTFSPFRYLMNPVDCSSIEFRTSAAVERSFVKDLYRSGL